MRNTLEEIIDVASIVKLYSTEPKYCVVMFGSAARKWLKIDDREPNDIDLLCITQNIEVSREIGNLPAIYGFTLPIDLHFFNPKEAEWVSKLIRSYPFFIYRPMLFYKDIMNGYVGASILAGLLKSKSYMPGEIAKERARSSKYAHIILIGQDVWESLKPNAKHSLHYSRGARI